MTDLAVNGNFLSLSSFKDTLVLNLDSYEKYVLTREEELQNKDKNKPEADVNYDGYVPIVSSSFSRCGKLFTCCAHKSLSVWNVEDWKLLCKKTISRSACKVIFSPKSDCIIVADKSGDVYLHFLNKFESPGELILGHVSMLLDVIVTPDEKFIITCDRDEKIRVSSYPNAYNINSYCLGHEEFVSCINILSNQYKLLSGSGDGTLRLWDYENGKELLSYSIREDVSTIKTFEDSPPVVYKVSILKEDNESSVICSLVFKTNALWLHNISFSPLLIKFSQVIKTESEPYCLQALSNKSQLWYLQLDEELPVVGFNLIFDKLEKCEESIKNIKQIIKNHINVVELNRQHERLITSLCKKKYNNETEYYKRKHERLEAEKVKRLAKS